MSAPLPHRLVPWRRSGRLGVGRQAGQAKSPAVHRPYPHTLLDQLEPLQELPDQLEPLQELPDQLEPYHELPDQELPDQL